MFKSIFHKALNLYLVRLWNHARIRSWNQPVLINKCKPSAPVNVVDILGCPHQDFGLFIPDGRIKTLKQTKNIFSVQHRFFLSPLYITLYTRAYRNREVLLLVKYCPGAW